MPALLALLLMGAPRVDPSRLVALSPPDVFRGPGAVVESLAPVEAPLPWDQAIVSWNVKASTGAQLRIEARVLFDDHETKWYVLGDWAPDRARGTRQSTEHQGDADGAVFTDTLSQKRRGGRLQLRLTGSGGGNLTRLSLLTVCLSDTSAPVDAGRPWLSPATRIEAPFKRQGAYPNGGVLCSPTSLSMVLNYWSARLVRPDLAKDVPEVAEGVFDPVYKGHGNWPFNMAFAGSLDGMMGYVSRFERLEELGEWTADGIPVVCSVSLQLLNGRVLDRKTESGHLVVVVGFTAQGDAILNDPAAKEPCRTVPRAQFEAAWDYSHRTVYLCHPMDHAAPRDRLGHWVYP